MPRQGPTYAFGDFRLDVAGRRLMSRAGPPVALADPVFDTLLHLVEHAGEMVERTVLLKSVWPHVTVVENSVSQAVSALRRALNDHPAAPRYVRTVSGRGYRFVAEVSVEHAPKRIIERDPRAQQLYVLGWSALSRPYGETLMAALDYLQQAVAIDPDFALAHACIAECYILIAGHGLLSSQETLPKALAAGARALEADPDLPDAQAVMTNLRAIKDGYQAGGESLRRLAERHPSCFWAQRYLGLWLMHTGDQQAAIEVLRRAQVIEPLAVHNSGNIGMALYFDSRFADAIDQLEITLRMDPAFGFARMFLGRSRLLFGQADRAIEEFERMPSTTMASRVEVAVAWALSERTDGARGALAELKQMPAVRAFELATLHAALGDQDEALTCLERAIDLGSFGFLVDPLFHALRDTPRFRALTARIGLSA